MASPFAAVSDVGLKRPHNEDSYRADPTLGLYLVADGMGGHAAGEVASQVVADAVVEFLVQTAGDGDPTWPFGFDPALSLAGNRLRAAILLANGRLSRRIEQNEALKGMATTISAVLFYDDQVVVSNVGDCRAYLVRDGTINQMTLDHSWVAEQVRAGLLTPDAARAHPWRSMVTRALAGGQDVSVDVLEFPVLPGDLVLLCSDGLHAIVTDEEILEVLRGHRLDLEAACRALIELANTRGGPDNVTAVLVRVET